MLFLLGTGKGGTSIWGRKFEDEFSEHFKASTTGIIADLPYINY